MKTQSGNIENLYNFSWDVIEQYFDQLERFQGNEAWLAIEKYILQKVDETSVDEVAQMLMQADEMGVHFNEELGYKDEYVRSYLISLNKILHVDESLTQELFEEEESYSYFY